jgi:hypothetical protein
MVEANSEATVAAAIAEDEIRAKYDAFGFKSFSDADFQAELTRYDSIDNTDQSVVTALNQDFKDKGGLIGFLKIKRDEAKQYLTTHVGTLGLTQAAAMSAKIDNIIGQHEKIAKKYKKIIDSIPDPRSAERLREMNDNPEAFVKRQIQIEDQLAEVVQELADLKAGMATASPDIYIDPITGSMVDVDSSSQAPVTTASSSQGGVQSFFSRLSNPADPVTPPNTQQTPTTPGMLDGVRKYSREKINRKTIRQELTIRLKNRFAAKGVLALSSLVNKEMKSRKNGVNLIKSWLSNEVVKSQFETVKNANMLINLIDRFDTLGGDLSKLGPKEQADIKKLAFVVGQKNNREVQDRFNMTSSERTEMMKTTNFGNLQMKGDEKSADYFFKLDKFHYFLKPLPPNNKPSSFPTPSIPQQPGQTSVDANTKLNQVIPDADKQPVATTDPETNSLPEADIFDTKLLKEYKEATDSITLMEKKKIKKEELSELSTRRPLHAQALVLLTFVNDRNTDMSGSMGNSFQLTVKLVELATQFPDEDGSTLFIGKIGGVGNLKKIHDYLTNLSA